MNSKIIELSYDTLYDIKFMLNKQIEKELQALNLLNYDDGTLAKLRNDRELINQAISELVANEYNKLIYGNK